MRGRFQNVVRAVAPITLVLNFPNGYTDGGRVFSPRFGFLLETFSGFVTDMFKHATVVEAVPCHNGALIWGSLKFYNH